MSVVLTLQIHGQGAMVTLQVYSPSSYYRGAVFSSKDTKLELFFETIGKVEVDFPSIEYRSTFLTDLRDGLDGAADFTLSNLGQIATTTTTTTEAPTTTTTTVEPTTTTTTTEGPLNQFDELAPSDLTLTVLSDTSIKIDFTINSINADGHKIERSIDGTNYTEIASVDGATATYTNTALTEGTRYYYRVRAYKNTTYSSYCTAANDWTAIKMVLTSTGTGAGVSTVRFWFDTTDVVVTLDGNGKWYSNAAGTLDESASYTFVAGSIQTRYLKVTSDVSNMLIFAKGNWLRWGDTLNNGFSSSNSAASIAKDISALTSLTYLRVQGSNTLSGSVAALTNLTHLQVEGSNTLSGSVANLTNLTYLRIDGSNTLSGSIAALTRLTHLYVLGSNTLSGSIAGLTNLTYLNVTGSNTLSGSIAGLTNLTYLNVSGSNTLSGDINSMVTDITTFVLTGLNQMDTYTSGAIWSLISSSTINPDVGYGYSSTEIDNMLIDMAASLGTVVGKTITLQGSSQPRTAASDAAVTTLNGKGWTIVTN